MRGISVATDEPDEFIEADEYFHTGELSSDNIPDMDDDTVIDMDHNHPRRTNSLVS